jgi:biotin transport system substrate-specific component
MSATAYTTEKTAARLTPATRTALLAGGAISFALLTAAAAHLRFYLPFTPVPITMQVLVVLLSGAVLGRGWGAASQGLYLGAGLAGAPVFAGAAAGLGILSGATAGFLFGFVLAPPVVAALLGRKPDMLRVCAAMAAGVGVIYTCGWAWLAFGLHMGPATAFFAGVHPFILLDTAKAALAAALFLPVRRLVQRPL